MKKSIIAVMFILPLVAVLGLTPILVNQVFAQNQMGMPMMSPRQQWMMTNNIEDITCREGMTLMIKDSNATPVCLSPNSYLRLADRGWGNFDMNMMVNHPQQMQGVMNSMMNNPQTGKLWYDIVSNNPQQMQEMMINNPWHMQGMMGQMTGPMMSDMMKDPQMRQQMMEQMSQNQQMMQELMQNQQFMEQLNP